MKADKQSTRRHEQNELGVMVTVEVKRRWALKSSRESGTEVTASKTEKLQFFNLYHGCVFLFCFVFKKKRLHHGCSYMAEWGLESQGD